MWQSLLWVSYTLRRIERHVGVSGWVNNFPPCKLRETKDILLFPSYCLSQSVPGLTSRDRLTDHPHHPVIVLPLSVLDTIISERKNETIFFSLLKRVSRHKDVFNVLKVRMNCFEITQFRLSAFRKVEKITYRILLLSHCTLRKSFYLQHFWL